MLRLSYFFLGSFVGALAMLSFVSGRLSSLEEAAFELAATSYYRACVEASGADCKSKAEDLLKQYSNMGRN